MPPGVSRSNSLDQDRTAAVSLGQPVDGSSSACPGARSSPSATRTWPNWRTISQTRLGDLGMSASQHLPLQVESEPTFRDFLLESSNLTLEEIDKIVEAHNGAVKSCA